jgi:hypothetical protein
MGYPPGESVSLLEAWVPRIRRPQVKDYRESPDLTILFNTERMAANNPLLALSSYGSWCWGEIGKGASVRRMQEESLRAFGGDEVVPFLSRLAGLGFIGPLPPGLLPLHRPEMIVKEFPAPEVQHGLIQAKIPWYLLWEISAAGSVICRTMRTRDRPMGRPNESRPSCPIRASSTSPSWAESRFSTPALRPWSVFSGSAASSSR